MTQPQSRLNLARDAVMLNDAAQVLAQARAVVAAHNANTVGTPPAPAGGDDMIHVGDQVTHNYPPPASAGPHLPIPLPSPAKVVGGLSKAATAALFIGSLLGGGGLATGGLALAGLLGKATAVAPLAPGLAPPQEFKIDFWIDELGLLQKKIAPVPPTK